MNNTMKINNTTVAIAEVVMGSSLLYVAFKTQGILNKTFAFSTSAYLFYGAYLNSQKRVVLLAKKPSGDK